MLQNGQDEIVFGWEVIVKAHLGDFRLGDDPVDPDGPDAVLVKEPVGGFENPLSGLGSAS